MIRICRYHTRAGLSLLLALVLAALAGCGYKDRPVPPQQVVPRPITDLRYQLSEKGVTLSWSYPIETVTGRDLTEISSFELYRAVVPVDSYCDTCPIPFGTPIELPGGVLPGEGRKTATYEATLLRPGNLYFFKVRARNGWWAESADSNIVSFLWNIPPRAPSGLKAVAGDHEVTLRWQPVTIHLDGSPITGRVEYQVLRSLGGGSFAKVGKPVSGTTFTDTRVRNGRKYFYRVQAIEVYKQGRVGGGSTAPVAVTPVDRTPPAPPLGVRAVLTGRGVKVFWQPVEERDLKGYRVYRRLPGDRAPELIGEVDAPYTMFVDKNPPADAARIFYSVSSIDNHTPANESASSPEVMLKQ